MMELSRTERLRRWSAHGVLEFPHSQHCEGNRTMPSPFGGGDWTLSCGAEHREVTVLGFRLVFSVPYCEVERGFGSVAFLKLLSSVLGISFVQRRTLICELEHRYGRGGWPIDDLPVAYTAGPLVASYYSVRDIVKALPDRPRCHQCNARRTLDYETDFIPKIGTKKFCSQSCLRQYEEQKRKRRRLEYAAILREERE